MPPAAIPIIAGGVVLGAGALSARNERKAAARATDAQVGAGREALAFGAEQVEPFRQIGIDAAGQVAGSVGSGAEFQGFNTDPSRIINNPLFQALSRDQEQRLINQQASLGRAGTGETNDFLTRNALLLGKQFQEQDLDRQQQEFQNRFSESQTRFSQLFDLTRLGGNVSTQQATSGSNIIQDIGNARSAGAIAKGNATSNFIRQIGGAAAGGFLGGTGAFGPKIGAGGGALLGFGG